LSEQRETVLILDFGSQYTQLIARRCREEGVFSRIEPWDWSIDEIHTLKPVGIILSGGPRSVYDKGAPQLNKDLLDLDIPLLGICYGMHLLVISQGGEVSSGKVSEYGRATVIQQNPSQFFTGLEKEQPVWMSHGDHVTQLPDGWTLTAQSSSGIVAAIEHPQTKLYGVQFHPEVSHTPSGNEMLRNFLYDINGATGGWDMHSFAQRAVEKVGETIGDGSAICGLSGGVDSSVSATLVHRAIGDRLRCILVDNGLLRKDEARQVEDVFRPVFGDRLYVVEARDEFLADLAGVSEPEEKRRLIGNRFIRVFEKEADRFQDAKFLVQGTLYPDVIESAGSRGPADVIKTHHNVGGLPEKLGLKLVEPLRDLFKDEVRQVGRELGLPESILMRHPFPGPGLAVRILGEVDAESVLVQQGFPSIGGVAAGAFGWRDG